MFTFDTCNAVISYVTAGALNVTSYSLILNCFSQQINALQTKRDISERVDKRPVMRDDICLTSCHALSSCPILLPLHCTATPPNLGFRGALRAPQIGSVRWGGSNTAEIEFRTFRQWNLTSTVIIVILWRRLCDIRNKVLAKFSDGVIEAGLEKI